MLTGLVYIIVQLLKSEFDRSPDGAYMLAGRQLFKWAYSTKTSHIVLVTEAEAWVSQLLVQWAEDHGVTDVTQLDTMVSSPLLNIQQMVGETVYAAYSSIYEDKEVSTALWHDRQCVLFGFLS